MKIRIENGRVIFNGETLKDANFDLQFKSNEILEKVKNDYTLDELIEMTKVKARSMGFNIDFVTEKIQ